MFAAGIFVLFIALLAWAGFGVQKYKAGRLAKTPLVDTGEAAEKGEQVAGDKGAISVEGQLNYDELLTSPVTGTKCLYYQLDVDAKWDAGESSESKKVMDEKKAVGFTLDDGSGPVAIDASQGGDFEDLETAFSKKKGRGIVSTSSRIEFGDNGFSVLAGQKVDGVYIPDDAKYEVVEKVLEPIDKAYANGKITENNEVGSPNWASLILSSKTYDEIVAGTEGFAQKLMYGAAASTVIGSGLAIASVLVG
jgi:hypothetical protein